MDVDKLKVLETKIERILAHHEAVRQERDRLSQRLGQAESRVQDFAARLQRHEKERAEIKARVERILNRLDGLDLA